ncbi:MAG TPA: hypothetical protein VNE71_07860, partial [Myxococcota bacterium]|nr:hypothetical protein [Myxococcota bacterium]
MKPYPHFYTVVATGAPAGSVTLETPGAPALASAPPAEFDGPGDEWSPESLLVGAVELGGRRGRERRRSGGFERHAAGGRAGRN